LRNTNRPVRGKADRTIEYPAWSLLPKRPRFDPESFLLPVFVVVTAFDNEHIKIRRPHTVRFSALHEFSMAGDHKGSQRQVLKCLKDALGRQSAGTFTASSENAGSYTSSKSAGCPTNG
jgi:hypothetical protein